MRRCLAAMSLLVVILTSFPPTAVTPCIREIPTRTLSSRHLYNFLNVQSHARLSHQSMFNGPNTGLFAPGKDPHALPVPLSTTQNKLWTWKALPSPKPRTLQLSHAFSKFFPLGTFSPCWNPLSNPRCPSY